MDRYDPDHPPDPQRWLALSDTDRRDRVAEHHRGAGVRPANARLHAALHVVVENQLAAGEAPVRETLARLQAEGLTRHDALHAIGSVVTELLLDLSKTDSTPDPEAVQETYAQRLARVTAADFLRSE